MDLWIPGFDTILKSRNDLCSSSMILLCHWQLHLKSPSLSNSQTHSSPYIAFKISGLDSSSDSIPCHFSLLLEIPILWWSDNKKLRDHLQKTSFLGSKTFRKSALKWVKRNKDKIPKAKTAISKPRYIFSTVFTHGRPSSEFTNFASFKNYVFSPIFKIYDFWNDPWAVKLW